MGSESEVLGYGSQVKEFEASKEKGYELICSNIHKNVLFVRILTIFIPTNVPFV